MPRFNELHEVLTALLGISPEELGDDPALLITYRDCLDKAENMLREPIRADAERFGEKLRHKLQLCVAVEAIDHAECPWSMGLLFIAREERSKLERLVEKRGQTLPSDDSWALRDVRRDN